MYFSFGTKSALETLVTLSKPYAPDRTIRDSAQLKAAYLEFLKRYQPLVPVPTAPALEFVTDAALAERLAGYFRVSSPLNDKGQGKIIENRFDDIGERIRRIEGTFGAFAETAQELADLFRIVINYLFCASSSSAGGGTTSSALGVIWAAHRDSWTQADVFEFFVHELTHNMLFLDECRFRHYLDYSALSLKENYVHSAILSIPRPLDKVVHSLMVAIEVLLFRENVTGHPIAPVLHPPTEILLSKVIRCLESIDGLPNRERLITPRGEELISRAREQIATLARSPSVKYA